MLGMRGEGTPPYTMPATTEPEVSESATRSVTMLSTSNFEHADGSASKCHNTKNASIKLIFV